MVTDKIGRQVKGGNIMSQTKKTAKKSTKKTTKKAVKAPPVKKSISVTLEWLEKIKE